MRTAKAIKQPNVCKRYILLYTYSDDRRNWSWSVGYTLYQSPEEAISYAQENKEMKHYVVYEIELPIINSEAEDISHLLMEEK